MHATQPETRQRPETPSLPQTQYLAEAEWTARRAAHVDRIDRLVGDYLRSRSQGGYHPVLDFLFTYYSFKPGHLSRWNPGFGVVLRGERSEDYAHLAAYEKASEDGYRVRASLLRQRKSAVEFTLELLSATSRRPPNLGCFGLHEWAMVYHGGPSALRHGTVPLRLGHSGTDDVVDSLKLRCTHYDAFRFFTDEAVPRNLLALEPSGRMDREQPGCVHASMDLYKWSYKLAPLVDSALIADCFELALEARTVDMRASPYDLSEYGLAPIAIETPAGRAEYVRAQTDLTARATPLRSELIGRCQNLLVNGGATVGPTAE